jgi:hypothetical protein
VEFLRKSNAPLGILEQWINLVMMCVRIANYAILFNGNPVERFYPTRGIRQGDPISPYMFLLCAEALSNLMTQVEERGLIAGVATSKRGPKITHPFFADDSLLFYQVEMGQWRRLSSLLTTYERASGK